MRSRELVPYLMALVVTSTLLGLFGMVVWFIRYSFGR